MSTIPNTINLFGIFKLNRVPAVGDSCYSNKYIIYDNSCTSFEFKYMPRGWDGAKSQILINLFSKGRLIIKLPFYIKPFEPEQYKEFGTNYTGIYRHMSNLVFNWRGKSWYWGIPFVEVTRKKIEVYDGNKWVSCMGMEYEEKLDLIKDVKKRLLFRNKLPSGTIQETVANVHIERSTWKRKWCPFTFKDRRIQFEFEDAIGRGVNTWKGGVCGSSLKMNKGESLDECYNRFCLEKNYD